jgi:hypothetical protein
MPEHNYESIWEKTENIPWCALVTTGRVGSDLFQSLLDSHPEIIVFNGALPFHTFWNNSFCVQSEQTFSAEDFMDEFIGNFIHKLKSKYDKMENKAFLGENKDQSLAINLVLFRKHCIGLIQLKPLTSRYFLQAVYLSYSLCLNEDLDKKKIFFHHIHHIPKLDNYLKDFPQSKVISMTRDPRATYVSGVENRRSYSSKADQPKSVFFILNRMIEDAQALKYKKIDFKVLKLEDLGEEDILREVCSWLEISYNDCLQHSTWGGLRWWGDRVSVSLPPHEQTGFSKVMINNKWESKLGSMDLYILNYLLQKRLVFFDYEHQGIRIFDHVLVFFLLFLPTSYELNHLSPSYFYKCIKMKNFKFIAFIFIYYPKRVRLFYKLYFKNWGETFYLPRFYKEHPNESKK